MAEPIDLKLLYGGQIAPPEVVQKGMAGLETELTKQYNEQESQRAIGRQYTQQFLKPLVDVIGKDQGAIQGIQSLGSLQQAPRKNLTPPEVVKESQRIFVGGATVAPPYNSPYTWNVTSGNPRVHLSADNTTGQMHFSLDTDYHKSSSARVIAAVGIFFSPFTDQGSLHISTNPTLSLSWALWCALNSAHSDGWIGLYIASYDLSGNAGTPIRSQIIRWSEDVFAGDPSGGGVDTQPLQARFAVDRDHYYVVWVWCGGSVSGAGWDSFFGSGAYSEMYVNVPSITWELS